MPEGRVKTLLKRSIRGVLKRTALWPLTGPVEDQTLRDMEKPFLALAEKCQPYTVTSRERMYALYKAVQYVVRARIPGDIVECGLWKGGSSMLAALALIEAGEMDRKFHLYDTFTGMSQPTAEDVDFEGMDAAARMVEFDNRKDRAPSGLEETRANLLSTGYPPERLVFVKGKVEDTIPGTAPEAIAILRLDTDWYESTLHELRHLFPLLSPGGVLIIDDYGHWRGARQAVDEYFRETQAPILLNRIDYTGRIAVKMA